MLIQSWGTEIREFEKRLNRHPLRMKAPSTGSHKKINWKTIRNNKSEGFHQRWVWTSLAFLYFCCNWLRASLQGASTMEDTVGTTLTRSVSNPWEENHKTRKNKWVNGETSQKKKCRKALNTWIYIIFQCQSKCHMHFFPHRGRGICKNNCI